MTYQIDHDLHIHSQLSLCSGDPEQTPERILQYAQTYGLSHICITDHFWDEAAAEPIDWYEPQNFTSLSSVLPLPQGDGVAFSFGCETDMNGDSVLGISKKRIDSFDFVVIPTTHLHIWVSAIQRQQDWDALAQVYVERLRRLLSMDLPWHKIGIAHLACGLIAPEGRIQEIFCRITDDTLTALFTKAAALGVGIEINADDFNFAKMPPERVTQVLRLFGLAKAAGCKFYLGSDAHHPADLEKAPPIFQKAVELLKLTEADKFRI